MKLGLLSTVLAGLVIAAPFVTNANAANVSSVASADAIKWQGGVINVEPLMAYYKSVSYEGIWTNQNGLNARGKELLDVLDDAWLDGLEPLDYLAGFPKKRPA